MTVGHAARHQAPLAYPTTLGRAGARTPDRSRDEPPAQNAWAGGFGRGLVMELEELGEGVALHVEAVAQ